MSKNRPNSGYVRDRTIAMESLQSSLAELRQSVVGIERGNNLACRTVAMFLKRILDDELPMATRGYKIRVRSYITKNTPQRLPFPLTTLEVSKSGTRIAPTILHDESYDVVSLQKWKTQKVFHGREASDFFQRTVNTPLLEDLSREKVIKFTRDEVGAHFDKEISKFSLISSKDYTMVDLRVIDEESETDSSQTASPHKWNYLSATLAAISFELLKSVSIIRHEGELLFVNHPE